MALVDFSLDDVGDLFRGIREAITGEKVKDPVEVLKMELELTKLENALIAGQLEINKMEAQNPHLFVSGWRPSIGWICSFAVGYEFIIYPLFLWFNALWWNITPPPHIDYSLLGELLFAMLGVAGLRTWEKQKNVDTKKVGN